MKTYLTILIAIIISCSSGIKNEKSKHANAENVAVVTKDSCIKWKLPITHFQIHYPKTYKTIFNPSTYYLSLTKRNDSGYISQEFTLGKSENIKTAKDIQQWTYVTDSLLSSLKIYQRKFIGYRDMAGKSYFLVSGEMNFDSFGTTEYKGDYKVTAILIPTEKQPNGVSVSIITRMDKDTISQYKEVNDILRTLEFLKD